MTLSGPKLRPTSLLAAIAVSVLSGCVTGGYLTRQEIDAQGTASYPKARRVVLHAVVSALESEGFKVSILNADTGVVKTDRREIRRAAIATSDYSASAVSYYRQYVIHVSPGGHGQTTVRAEPRIYAGDTDISDRPIWALSGPEGEPTLWPSSSATSRKRCPAAASELALVLQARSRSTAHCQCG